MTDVAFAVLHDVLHEGIAANQHLGAQALVLTPDGEYHVSVGTSAPGVPMVDDLALPWMCCTKLVTATAVMREVGAGRLSVDDPVSAHVPAFTGSATLRHLLTHTGGLAPVPDPPPTTPWREAVDRVATTPAGAPGEAAYDPTGSWFLLAEAVRVTSGLPFRDYAERHILGARCPSTWLALSRGPAAPAVGRLYHCADQVEPTPVEQFPPIHEDDPVTCLPGFGAFGPAGDLARLCHELLRSVAGESDLLPAEAAALMTSKHRVGQRDPVYGGALDWGLGPVVDGRAFSPVCSGATFGHTGQESSLALADPEADLALAVIFNGLPGRHPHRHRRERAVAAIYEDLGLVPAGTTAAIDPTVKEGSGGWRVREEAMLPAALRLPDVAGFADEEIDALLRRPEHEHLVEECLELVAEALRRRPAGEGTLRYVLLTDGDPLIRDVVMAETVSIRPPGEGEPTGTARMTVHDFLRTFGRGFTPEGAWHAGRLHLEGNMMFHYNIGRSLGPQVGHDL